MSTRRHQAPAQLRGRPKAAAIVWPAPRAVTNLMDAASAQLKLHTKVREKLLDIGDDALFDYHLVFMHGRNAFRLTDAERKQLKLYLQRGGMLLADSICANKAFTDSFRREMATIFPARKLGGLADRFAARPCAAADRRPAA